MTFGDLRILARPSLRSPRLVMGLSGWMDGGEVSTGTIEWLVKELDGQPLAEIDPRGYYVYQVPGHMEVAAMFRPATKIEEGAVRAFQMPVATFHHSEPHDLVLFQAREPNLAREAWAERVFELVDQFSVRRIYFIGSVAGTVPHTRDPRLFGTVSLERLKEELAACGIRLSNYAGPASIITLLLHQAAQRGIEMISLAAEIPAYIQGVNPRSIEAVTRKLAGMLGLQVSLTELRELSDEFERKLDAEVHKQPKLAALIAKLEHDYDHEVFDTQMEDLKHWLEQRGLRLD